MNKVLKLQRVGLITPTLVEYDGKVLATNQLDIESTCNLWRCHFGFYPNEKIDLAMTKKEFSVIQQKTLSSVKSVYDLFYEQNFIPRVFESKEGVSEWGMYRTNEVGKLKSENAELKEKAQKLDEQLKAISDRTAKFPSLEQIEKRFIDWAIPFLKARITGCKEEWFGIEWIAKAIWEFIKDGFETAIAVNETNVALRERLAEKDNDN